MAPDPDASSLLALEDARRAHAGADAHGHDAELLPRPLELRHQRGELARACAAERVPEGDGAALWVDLLSGDLQVVDAHGRLRREGLIDLPDVDIVHLQTGLLERGGNRVGGPDAHVRRVHADARVGAEAPDDRELHLLGDGPARQEHAGGAVGDLARVARRRGAVSLEGGLQAPEALGGGASPRALVLRDHDLRDVSALVLDPGLDRHDL
mmetsp:Transcript_49411/g.145940  ORF Transcript_49411/g.145940 Transcript_49411/m.145940 type:complete len:211 (+) Transcript_49411:151-783(+)